MAPGAGLTRIAEQFGLSRPTVPGAPLAAAILQADPLWTAPAAGAVQPGLQALFGGFVPAALVGVQLWPILNQSGPGPDLLLTDVRGRIVAAVDVEDLPGAPGRPAWVLAARVARSVRMPGSTHLWRHWHPELSESVPHDWTDACDGHVHLARADVRGQAVTGIPQHDAWVMSRSWVPAELQPGLATDVHWIVLSASDRGLRDREPQIRSQWSAVSFDEFAGLLCAPYDGRLPRPIADLIQAMLTLQPVAVAD